MALHATGIVTTNINKYRGGFAVVNHRPYRHFAVFLAAVGRAWSLFYHPHHIRGCNGC